MLVRFIKYEKKNTGRGSCCYGCDVPVETEVLNLVSFKDTERAPKRLILCNSCAAFLGGELIIFSGKKGYPINVILGTELRQHKQGQRLL